MFEKNSIFEMTCTAFGQDAQGVCRHDGIVVFVPDLLPGEQALVRIVKPERNFAYGRVEQRITSSPDRQLPFCPIAKRCGGCTCQHMTYTASLEYKRQQVEDLLNRVGHIPVKVPPVIGMDHPYHYRNKGMYPIGTGHDGPVCGFFAQRTHDLIPLPSEGCTIQDEASSKAVSIVLKWIHDNHIPVYNEHSHTGIVRHLMTRCTTAGRLMIVLVVTKSNVPHTDDLISALLTSLPQIQSIALSINAKPGNTILGQDIRLLYGDSEMHDQLLGLTFAVSPLSFFQVNPQQTQKLYQLALDYTSLTGNENVIDAYCGTGTISLLLARQAKQVIGIEIVDAAIQNARRNAKDNHIGNATFITGATEIVLPKLADDGIRPDVIVLDPPRKGCDPEVLEAIRRVSPSRIVYVSCSAPTLARDLNRLTAFGYSLDAVQCVDMFCWTSSIETVCLLSKIRSAPHIDIDLDMTELDVTKAETKATYEEIKAYVLEHTGLKVSCLYIAQVKAKHGIIERDCYNKAKTEGNRVPKCPPEKEKAIEEALRHFQMIP